MAGIVGAAHLQPTCSLRALPAERSERPERRGLGGERHTSLRVFRDNSRARLRTREATSIEQKERHRESARGRELICESPASSSPTIGLFFETRIDFAIRRGAFIKP